MPSEISLDNIEDESSGPIASSSPTTPTVEVTKGAAESKPPPPDTTTAEDETDEDKATPPEVNEPAPPSDLKEAFQMLAQADAMPERTPAEKEARDQRLAFIRKHVARLQEGLPTLPMDANLFAQAFQTQIKSLHRERLEILARDHREVADLLEERDRLAKELECLRTATR